MKLISGSPGGMPQEEYRTVEVLPAEDGIEMVDSVADTSDVGNPMSKKKRRSPNWILIRTHTA